MKSFLPTLSLAALVTFAGVAGAQTQVQREERLGTGRVTDFAAPPAPVPAPVAAPAPFGRMAIVEWKENVDSNGRIYPYAFRDPDNNWWFLGFQSRHESFANHPAYLDGWVFRIDNGCWRFATHSGSFFVGSKGQTSVDRSFTPVVPAPPK